MLPNQLKIDKGFVGKLLDEKKPDDESENYATLIKMLPKFTDEDNSVLHEVATFISFSGSTGLPSTMGPDEANFDQYLQTGQLVDKLGEILKVSKPDKKKSFVKKNLDALTKATDEPKFNALGAALKLSSMIEEWSAQLPQWKTHLYSLPPDKQDVLMSDFWTAVLQRNSELVGVVKSEKPNHIASLWSVLDALPKDTLHKDAQSELEKVVKADITTRPPILGGVEIFFRKFGDATLGANIDAQLVDPAICKVFLDEVKKLNLGKDRLAEIIKKKLQTYLRDFTHVDWAIANKDFLKGVDLFEIVKTSTRKWAKDVGQLIKVAEQGNNLELSEEDKRSIAGEVVTLTNKLANLGFLDNANVLGLLKKEDKLKIFENLKDILNNPDDSLDKRKQATELFMKSRPVWSGVDTNDVYGYLKEIRKFKLGRFADLKDKPKEIIDSWGYNEPSEDKEENKIT